MLPHRRTWFIIIIIIIANRQSILRHIAKSIPAARQGTILSPHRVIGIAANTSMVLKCAVLTYIMMTADVGLPRAV